MLTYAKLHNKINNVGGNMKNERFKMLIAERLKRIRQEHDDTIVDLARKSGVSTSTISFYENGKENMNVDKIEQIIAPYNISLGNFFSIIYAKMQEKEDH